MLMENCFIKYNMNNDRTCRICLEEEIPMISLYQCLKDIDENVHLNHIIKELAKIEIQTDDGLPDKICEFCLEELKRTCKFITQIQESDKSLRSVEVLETSLKADSFIEEYLEDELNYTDVKTNIKQENTPVVKVEFKADSNDDMSIDSYRSDEDVDDPEERTVEDFEENKTDGVTRKSLDNHEETHLSSNIIPDSYENSINEREHDYSKLQERGKDDKNPSRQDTRKDILKTDIMCNICDKIFETKRSLKIHIHEEHDFEYKCEYCEKSFPQKMNLQVHMRAHVPDDKKKFSCQECSAVFSYEYQLTRHSFKHKDEKPFPCPKCDKGCLTADSLKRHLKVHEQNYAKPTHVCQVCFKEFSYPSFLAEHMKNHTGEKPFLCSHCGKGFRQKGALLYHVRSHQNIRPFKCELCDNSFVSQGILRVHMRRHTNERPYVCDVCGRAFRQSSDCRMHRRIHFGLKLVECSVCKKKMSTTGQLTIHMRVHTGEKPYSCTVCLKRFATRTVLSKHQRTHTGEKPYVCSVCGRAFSQSSSLNTHMKIHLRTKENEKKEKEKPKQPVVIVKVK